MNLNLLDLLVYEIVVDDGGGEGGEELGAEGLPQRRLLRRALPRQLGLRQRRADVQHFLTRTRLVVPSDPQVEGRDVRLLLYTKFPLHFK